MTIADERERVEFTVMYDGLALADQRMSVRDLAPALLGFADLLQEANATLNPGMPAPSLNIKATAQGSFLVELALVHDQIRDFLLNKDVIALSVLVGLVSGPFGVLAWFRDRKKSGVTEEVLPNGAVRMTLPDGTRIEFPGDVLRLTREPGIRRAAQAVVEPLRREGIEVMEVRSTPRGTATVSITSDDLPNIEAAIQEEGRNLITDQRYTALLTITSPNFQAGKWRLSDGQGTYWMAVDDPQLRGQIDRHEIRFGKDDRLRGEVWFRQWETESGTVHAERSVTRVDEVLFAPVVTQTTVFDHIIESVRPPLALPGPPDAGGTNDDDNAGDE